MEQYIKKSTLVEEIKRISCENPMDNLWYVDTEELLNFLDTIKVKEVDLDEEFSKWWKSERAKDYNVDILYEKYSNTSMKLSKHFYELGLKAK